MKEIKIKGFGDLPKLVSVNIMLMEYLADGARVARQLLRQPNVAAPLSLQLSPYCFSYVGEFIHSAYSLPSLALKKQPRKKRGNFLHYLPLWFSGLPN